MIINNNIEIKRQSLQITLDLQKVQKERNVLGQFSTPKPLADAIIKASLAYINEKIRFLDTSIGTGVFFSSLLDYSDKKSISFACGYEIDNYYALPSIKLWKGENINYVVGDFLESKPPQNDE